MNTLLNPRHALRAAALLATAVCAHAATITWNPAQAISGIADVSTTGDFLYAFNLGGVSGGNPVNTTVNGVVFSGAHTAGVANKYSWTVSPGTSGWSATSYSSTSNPFNALNAGYKTLLQSAIRADNAGGVSGAATLTLLGLTEGNQYQVQLWSNDSRGNATAYANSASLSSPGGGSVTLDANSLTSGFGGLGQFVLGTFVATATSQTISLASLTTTSGNHDGVILNAFQVRDLGAVPEPATASLLLGVGALAATALRRRRA